MSETLFAVLLLCVLVAICIVIRLKQQRSQEWQPKGDKMRRWNGKDWEYRDMTNDESQARQETDAW